jgi:hypothetical protein
MATSQAVRLAQLSLCCWVVLKPRESSWPGSLKMLASACLETVHHRSNMLGTQRLSK